MLANILDWFGFGSADHGHDHAHGTTTITAHGHGHTPWRDRPDDRDDRARHLGDQVVVRDPRGRRPRCSSSSWPSRAASRCSPTPSTTSATRRPRSRCGSPSCWRGASRPRRFTYGYGRVEDLAGIVIVLIILFSAIVAGWQAIDRLIHPQPIAQLGWVAAAGVIGFIGNEAVAVFRIRVGREINSAALIADGYHARTDGLTSLAVVLGAIGVWLGFPLADPIVGLLITVAIFGIVWQSARAVLTRMLDGVEPGITEEIRHAAEHVPNVEQVLDIKTRWLGHPSACRCGDCRVPRPVHGISRRDRGHVAA